MMLTVRVRSAVLAAALATFLAVLACAGGCASNSSRNWAQNSPVIMPSHSAKPVVSLGVVEQGS